MTIVLISCVSKKLSHEATARELYRSDLFCKSLRYAESLRPDAIYVLSAKYGLVALNEEIEPYERTLNQMPLSEVKEWARSVLDKLSKVTKPDSDRFVVLAGERYRKYLVPHLTHCDIPMRGLRIGEQLRFLTPAHE